MSNKNYFEDDSLNFSFLSNLASSPAYCKKMEEQESEDKEYFIIGSGVDILLTEPDKFWEHYYLQYKEKNYEITPQMVKFIDYLVNNENCGEISGNCYQEAYEYAGIAKKKLDTVITEFKEKYQDYYQYCLSKNIYNINNQKKQLLTNAQHNLIQNIADSLINNEFTKKYFQNTTGTSIEIHTQLEIYWEIKDEKAKSKLDFIFIDHENKTIQPIDLKTTGKPVSQFKLAVLNYRYDLQACFYSMGLYWLINKSNDDYWSNLKHYKILPFKFIVESTKVIGMPLIFVCSDSMLQKALEGFYYQNRYYKGINELIDDYKWHRDNNNWTYSRDIIEKEGEVVLNYD